MTKTKHVDSVTAATNINHLYIKMKTKFSTPTPNCHRFEFQIFRNPERESADKNIVEQVERLTTDVIKDALSRLGAVNTDFVEITIEIDR